MEEQKKTIAAGTTIVENNFSESFQNGTTVNFKLEATVENLNTQEVEEILTFVAQSSRKFYLEVAKNFNNTL
ncbi:hypothetical protein U1P98_12815 [Lysinibacillus irui]|uniref:Uncharacterized protein n=2 Tax=Lysinibacillus TaxID=400634 RepID=A0A2X0Z187_9BACI|nr:MULTISPECIES: hypothetical protein [Lysinibacillus]MEA0555599.1 hypothetical protein [Lysinibacillus irui]MEA0977184.1 hypothetical protein [Lysinibacillus irui]MEA1043338.1 hypothetical protein [Lysinibacillus irui]SPT95602.1 Uncharacterised protein [Lysinibacillus capsici]